MTLTKQQIIEAAIQAGFTDKDYGLRSYNGDSDFNGEIGVEEYACGDKVLELFKNLGIKVEG